MRKLKTESIVFSYFKALGTRRAICRFCLKPIKEREQVQTQTFIKKKTLAAKVAHANCLNERFKSVLK